MPWELSGDLQKQVKDDKEYSKSELFESEKSEKKCPFCCTEIDLKACRCPNCTSELPKDDE